MGARGDLVIIAEFTSSIITAEKKKKKFSFSAPCRQSRDPGEMESAARVFSSFFLSFPFFSHV